MEKEPETTAGEAGAIVLFIILVPFMIYGVIAFIIWMFSDPFGIIPDIEFLPSVELPVRSPWDECVSDARMVYDNFNDTVGAHYAQGDEPSKEVQEFIKLCLEKNN